MGNCIDKLVAVVQVQRDVVSSSSSSSSSSVDQATMVWTLSCLMFGMSQSTFLYVLKTNFSLHFLHLRL